MNRLFLYRGFLFILILIFDAYDRDYNQPQVSSTNIAENNTIADSKQPPQTDSIKPDSSDKSSPITKNIDVLESNKLIIEFDINTGELLYSELKDFTSLVNSWIWLESFSFCSASVTTLSKLSKFG